MSIRTLCATRRARCRRPWKWRVRRWTVQRTSFSSKSAGASQSPTSCNSRSFIRTIYRRRLSIIHTIIISTTTGQLAVAAVPVLTPWRRLFLRMRSPGTQVLRLRVAPPAVGAGWLTTSPYRTCTTSRSSSPTTTINYNRRLSGAMTTTTTTPTDCFPRASRTMVVRFAMTMVMTFVEVMRDDVGSVRPPPRGETERREEVWLLGIVVRLGRVVL